MDTSEKYIKMCDCPEIQEKGRKQVGHKSDDKVLHRKANYIDISCHFGSIPICNPEWFIWLPRQDQIQEILGEPDFSLLFWSLWRFCDKDWDKEAVDKAESMEQLWLGFYMYEKHGKTWDGKDWKGRSSGGKEGL